MSVRLGRVQLRIMQVLWERGRVTAKEITEALNQDEPIAHSTVQTLLRGLEAKRAVTHDVDGRTFLFRHLPLVSLPGMQPLANAEWETFEVEQPAKDEPSEPALPAPRARDEALSTAERSALHLPPAAGNGDAIASDDAFNRQTLFEMAENDVPRDERVAAEQVVLSDEFAASEAAEAAALGAPVYATRLVWRVSRTTTPLALLASLVWVVASLAPLSRLVVEILRVALRRGAHAVTGLEQWLCAELARRVDLRPPDLLQTPFVASPCLVGISRPAILLPEELGEDSLDVALVHELAHLRRGDCLWNLLRQVSCAVLCFQPLMWRLSRHIERTAEEVCDDYAVQFGADCASYADLLVRLAEQSWLPASYAAVPLVTLRSAMGKRVALDRSRDPLVISGRVVGPDGEPVAEAWVLVIGQRTVVTIFMKVL